MRPKFLVLHQLHCLNIFHDGYWTSHHAATQDFNLVDEGPPVGHVRHCINLTQQSLVLFTALVGFLPFENVLALVSIPSSSK